MVQLTSTSTVFCNKVVYYLDIGEILRAYHCGIMRAIQGQGQSRGHVVDFYRGFENSLHQKRGGEGVESRRLMSTSSFGTSRRNVACLRNRSR